MNHTIARAIIMAGIALTACGAGGPAANVTPVPTVLPTATAAATATPVPTLAPTQPPATSAPTTAPVASEGWQTYTNTEAGFSIQYPPGWSWEQQADQSGGMYQTVALKGPEGGVDLHWGQGFGGGCPEGFTTIQVAQGDLPVCYAKRDDGTSFWSNMSKQLAATGFAAEAYTSQPDAASHDLLLKVLSTLRFTP